MEGSHSNYQSHWGLVRDLEFKTREQNLPFVLSCIYFIDRLHKISKPCFHTTSKSMFNTGAHVTSSSDRDIRFPFLTLFGSGTILGKALLKHPVLCTE